MNMNRPTAMSTTGVAADVSSRGYGDQIAAHYRVGEALTPELELKLEAVGERRLRKLLHWVAADDDESSAPLLSTRSASSSSASSTEYEPPPPMKLMQEKENYRVYEQQHEREKLLVMKGVLLLQSSSVDDVMTLLSGRTAADTQDFLTDVFASQYGDSAVLHHVDMHAHAAFAKRRAAAANASVAHTLPLSTTMLFQWLALRDTSPQLPLRDFLFMRFNQTFGTRSDDPVTPNSSRGSTGSAAVYGASVWESIEIASCRPLFSPTTMVRQRFKHCGFVVESANDTSATRVTFFITAPLEPQTLANDRTWLLRMAAAVRLIPSALVNQRIRLHQLIDKAKWDARDKCALCTTTFSLMKRPHHCRLCGTSVCSKCGTLRRDTRARHAAAVRVCLSCLNGEDTSALWGTSMSTKHFSSHSTLSHSSSYSNISAGSLSGRGGGSSRNGVGHPTTATPSASAAGGMRNSRDSAASKDSWSSRGDAERSRTSGHSSSVASSFSSSSRSFDDAGADADAALASLRIKLPAPSATSTILERDRDEDDVVANTSFAYPLTFHRGMAWPDFPVPPTEQQRLARIRTLNLSQQYAASSLKELLDLARTSICCPVATVAVITASTCLLVTSVGLAGDQLPRDVALESHVIMSREPFVILDTLADERFAKNPLVAQLHIRFYIGLPLVTRDGVVVGSLSLGDVAPRDMVKGTDLRALVRLAARIVDKMDAGGIAAAAELDHATAAAAGSGASMSNSAAPIGGMLLL